MKGSIISIKQIFLVLVSLSLITGVLNNNEYLLISGNYIFLTFAVILGGIILIYQKKIKLSIGFISFFIMFVATVIGCVIAWSKLSTGVFFSFLLVSLLGCELIGLDLMAKDIVFLINGLKYGALAFALGMALFSVDFWGGGWRYSLRIGNGPTFDPNYLGAVLATGFAISIFYSLNSIGKKRILNGIYSLIFLISVFFTGSRGAFVAVAIVIALSLLQEMKNSGLTAWEIIRNIIVVILLISILIIVIEHLPQRIFYRFFIADYSDGSNSRRVSLWKSGFDTIMKSPVFGFGCMEEKKTIGTEAHNTYISIWLDLGLMTISTFLLNIMHNCMIFLKKGNFLFLGVVLQSLVTSFIIGAAFSLQFWIVIIFSTLYCKHMDEINEIIARR